MSRYQISQSLVKDRRKVLRGELCPRIFRSKWIDRDWKDEPSEAMRAGQCFEYWATGQKNYHDEIPQPDVVYAGKPNQKLASAFEKAYIQAERFKEYCEEIGITDIVSGRRAISGDLRATIDIEANLKGVPVVIDLKYSGLIGNKWEELGWYEEVNFMSKRTEISFTPEQAEYHGIQVWFNTELTGKPFYFWIFSSGKDEDSRLVEVTLAPETRERFANEVNQTREWLESELSRGERGFFPRPKLTECRTCPLPCFMRAKAPYVEQITI